MTNLINLIDQKYIQRVCEIAKNGTCLRKKVGAALLRNPFKVYTYIDYENDKNLDWIKERILHGLNLNLYLVSEAYNTSVDLENTCEKVECLLIDGHCNRTIHSEIQCILNATDYQRKDAWIYVSTAPCWKCFQQIAYIGIKRVVYKDDSYWKTHPEFENHIKELAKKKEIELKLYEDSKS